MNLLYRCIWSHLKSRSHHHYVAKWQPTFVWTGISSINSGEVCHLMVNQFNYGKEIGCYKVISHKWIHELSDGIDARRTEVYIFFSLIELGFVYCHFVASLSQRSRRSGQNTRQHEIVLFVDQLNLAVNSTWTGNSWFT